MEKGQYDVLIHKIDGFIRRFYLNKVVRGSIYAVGCMLGMYLVIFSWIYFSHPGAVIKTIVFFLFVAVSIALIYLWMLRPLLSLVRLGKHLSTEEAAQLIGQHFSGVKDKLLNTLQLKRLADLEPANNRLVVAGITQRINELRPVPFSTAVRMRDNRKYLKYLLFPALAIVLIAIVAPAMLREGTTGFLNYDRYIPPKAPFNFILGGKNLTVMQGDDLRLQLTLEGQVLPNEAYLQDGINTYKLEKQDKMRFTYVLQNLQRTKTLSFTAGGFSSESFTVTVVPKPALLNMQALITYPAYLGKKPALMQQGGDLQIPEGSTVRWKINAEHATTVNFRLGSSTHALPVQNGQAIFAAVIRQDMVYALRPLNTVLKAGDSLAYGIIVIKDQLPEIRSSTTGDSLSRNAYYFTGEITDDYGFSNLVFTYTIRHGKTVRKVTRKLPVGPGNSQRFFHSWKLDRSQVKPGDAVEYYFEVADNDAVNGPKKVRSASQIIQVETEEQQRETLKAGSESLKQKIKSAVGLAAQVEKETKKIGESLLDKKQLSSEDRKQIAQLLQKQQQLDQVVRDIRELNERNNLNRNEFAEPDADLQEKQKQLEDLFNNALDEKTQELLEKLQALIDQNSKEQTSREMSKMQLDNKTLKKELDRILELYKQLEFEQELKSSIDALKSLAREQRELWERTSKPAADLQQLSKEQNNLSDKLQDLKKEMNRLQQKDQTLERPNNFERPEKELSDISRSMQESSDALGKSDKNRSAGKQKQAAAEMEKLAAEMQKMQQESEEKEDEVNVGQLRKLLENLLKGSFEQEKVMLALKKMNTTDPAYAATVQKQRAVKDNMKTIADSLYALSRRVPQIETPVNEEVGKIDFNIDKALESLGERRTAEAGRFQQFAMTSLNNLAVMLNEALDQLQRARKNAGGKGKGKQSQSMQQLAKMQEQLNQNMQQAREQIQRSGNQGKVPKGQMSEQFARMAQQQQLIRESLQKLNIEKNKNGKGGLGNLNQAVDEMKKTESDLVNKRLQQETILRQKNLLTKLLDAEKAERDQDKDEKRQSQAGKDFPPNHQKMLEKFKTEGGSTEELLNKTPPGLNSYYKNTLNEYYKLLDLRKR